MDFPVFNQQKYPQSLGVSEGYSIAKFGCALVSITELVNFYGHTVSPDILNLSLSGFEGFAENGTMNADGSKNLTLLKWSALTSLYPDIILDQNIAYPKTPADMHLLDSYLAKNQPVIVGVSFTHNPTQEVPSHYVVIYQKNSDGTYQCADPWFGDRAVFDNRYAVNGMTVAQSILQIVAYKGPTVLASVSQAPATAAQQEAQTIEDTLRKQRDDNWNLHLDDIEQIKKRDAKIQELQTQNQQLQDDISKRTNEVRQNKDFAGTYAQHLADLEKNDSSTITSLQKQVDTLKDKADAAETAAEVLQTKPTKFNLLQVLDAKLSEISFLKRKVKEQIPLPVNAPTPIPAPKSVLELLGVIKGVNTK